MKNHSATITIDPQLLFEQKCDLLDVIGFLELQVDDYPITLSKKRMESLNGILHVLDAITDQIPNYCSDQGEN